MIEENINGYSFRPTWGTALHHWFGDRKLQITEKEKENLQIDLPQECKGGSMKKSSEAYLINKMKEGNKPLVLPNDAEKNTGYIQHTFTLKNN